MLETSTLDEAQELLNEYVHEGLSSLVSGGSDEHYAQLTKELSGLFQKVYMGALEEVPVLHRLLRALRCSVSILDHRKHTALCATLFCSSLWIDLTILADLVDLYLHLAVVNGAFTETVVNTLCNGLTPTAPPPDPDPTQAWVLPTEAMAVQRLIVDALGRLVVLVPTMSNQILSALSRRAPFRGLPREHHCLYMTGIVALAEHPSASALRGGLESLAIGHLVEIDCEIKWEHIMEGRRPVQEEAPDADIFGMDGVAEGTPTPAPSDLLDEGAAHPTASFERLTSTMDSLMEIALTHYTRLRDQGRIKEVAGPLLSAFEQAVLPSSRLKFTQYVFFFVSGASHEFCQQFVQLLARKMTDVAAPTLLRIAALSYLASFVARAAHVPPQAAVEATGLILQRATDYLNDLASRPSSGPTRIRITTGEDVEETRSHDLFYATVEGCLYATCFLLGPRAHPATQPACRDLLARLLPLLRHPLRPLAVCSPSISAEFLQAAHHSRLADEEALGALAALVDSSARSSLLAFPFDPYLLVRSSRLMDLAETYVAWRKGAPTHHSASASESESESDSDDSGTEDLGKSLEMMSVGHRLGKLHGGFGYAQRAVGFHVATGPDGLSPGSSSFGGSSYGGGGMGMSWQPSYGMGPPSLPKRDAAPPKKKK